MGIYDLIAKARRNHVMGLIGLGKKNTHEKIDKFFSDLSSGKIKTKDELDTPLYVREKQECPVLVQSCGRGQRIISVTSATLIIKRYSRNIYAVLKINGLNTKAAHVQAKVIKTSDGDLCLAVRESDKNSPDYANNVEYRVAHGFTFSASLLTRQFNIDLFLNEPLSLTSQSLTDEKTGLSGQWFVSNPLPVKPQVAWNLTSKKYGIIHTVRTTTIGSSFETESATAWHPTIF